YARRRRLEAQPHGACSACRRDRQAALRRHGSGTAAARAADTRGARRVSEGRDRKMVADHKGGEHQSGMRPIFTAPIFHNFPFREPQVLLRRDDRMTGARQAGASSRNRKGGLAMSSDTEILALEDKRYAAMCGGDFAALEAMLHDEL